MNKKVTVARILFLSILLGWMCKPCMAQEKSLPKQESELVHIYSKLFASLYGDRDTLDYYSNLFGDKMEQCIISNPESLHYPFQMLKDSNFCFVTTSADGVFRKYTWNTWQGGTMHIFDEIDQYQSNGKTFAATVKKEEDGDPGKFCSKIFTVQVAGKVYYLSVDNDVYSSKDAAQSIKVYTIDHDKLIDTVKLFKTKTKLLNTIDVDFDFFSVVDRPERPLELITYDEKLHIIYIPVVNDEGKVTDKNILYQLKDKYFEFIGIEKGKRK